MRSKSRGLSPLGRKSLPAVPTHNPAFHIAGAGIQQWEGMVEM